MLRNCLQAFFLFSFSLGASASSATHESQPINWWGLGSAYADNPALGWYVITFAIFVFGLVFLVRKPLAQYLEARARQISQAIDEAKIAKEQAHLQLKEFDAQLKNLDEQIRTMRADFQSQGEMEKQRLAVEAQKISERIQHETAMSIRAESMRLVEAMKNELAVAVIKQAMEKISHGTAVAEGSLRQEFIRDIAAMSH